MRGFSFFNVLALTLGLAFLYIPDPAARDLFVQRIAARHRLGRISRRSGTGELFRQRTADARRLG